MCCIPLIHETTQNILFICCQNFSRYYQNVHLNACQSIIGFIEIGGYERLEYLYMRSVSDYTLENQNVTCGYPRDDAFHIFRHIWTSDFPWLATLIRTTFGSLWYWCANQVSLDTGVPIGLVRLHNGSHCFVILDVNQRDFLYI